MWPGSISISASRLPKGGTALFAFLALAGDLGGAEAPAIVGYVSQMFGGSIQNGILAGICFPVLLVICVILLKRKA
jgi:fucose permease